MFALSHDPTHAQPSNPFEVGQIVCLRRDDGGVDLAEIKHMWTAVRAGTPMLTVVRRPFGFWQFHVRADAVIADEPGSETADCDGVAVVQAGGIAYCEEHRSIATAPQWSESDALLTRAAPRGYRCGQQIHSTGGTV